jgi:hypothetical protein
VISGLSALARHHPWWLAAALAVPALTAVWGVIGPHLLESRHTAHMFGDGRSTGRDG